MTADLVVTDACASAAEHEDSKCEARLDELVQPTVARDDCSTDFSSGDTATPSESQSEDGDASVRSFCRLAVLPAFADEHLSVKCTFIHITAPSDGAISARRRCKSAPVFPCRERGLSEDSIQDGARAHTGAVSQVNPKANFPVTGFSLPPRAASQFDVGAQVVIEGLLRLPEFNGRTGTIVGWNAETCRYDIALQDTAGSQSRAVKVRAENLEPCPPSWSPKSLSSSADCDNEELDAMWPSTPRWEDSCSQASDKPRPISWVASPEKLTPMAPAWSSQGRSTGEASWWQQDTCYGQADWWSCSQWGATARAGWEEPACGFSLEHYAQMPCAR